MAELELIRSKGDRRHYTLGALGSLRLEGLTSRRATASAAGRNWHIAGPGLFSRQVLATAEGGAVVGAFDPRPARPGGELRWNGQPYELRPARAWRERYALVVGETEVATFDGTGWGKRPAKVDVVRPEAIDPGLMLFTAFVVRGLGV